LEFLGNKNFFAAFGLGSESFNFYAPSAEWPNEKKGIGENLIPGKPEKAYRPRPKINPWPPIHFDHFLNS